MTPFRGTSWLEENEKRFTTLPSHACSILGAKHIDAYWLVGHWTGDAEGCPEDETPNLVSAGGPCQYLEYSWLLVTQGDQVISAASLSTARFLAEDYGRGAFIIRLGGETTLRASGTVGELLQSDRSINNTRAALAQLRARSDSYEYADVLRIRDHEPSAVPTAGRELTPEDQERAAGLGSSPYVVQGSHSHYPAEFFRAVTSNISSKMYFAPMRATDLLPNGEESRAPWNIRTPDQIKAAKWTTGGK